MYIFIVVHFGPLRRPINKSRIDERFHLRTKRQIRRLGLRSLSRAAPQTLFIFDRLLLDLDGFFIEFIVQSLVWGLRRGWQQMAC